MVDFKIDPAIRKHTLIVQRLRNIQEMQEILQGNSSTYKKHMNDKMFINSVKHNLEIENELLEDLLNTTGKIVIDVSCGIVQGVYTNMNGTIEIEVLDEDTDGLPVEEFDERVEANQKLAKEIENMRCIY